MLSPLIDRLKTLILLTDIEVRKNVSLLLGEESEKEVHFPENWNTCIIVDEQLELFDERSIRFIVHPLVCVRKIDRIGTTGFASIKRLIVSGRESDRDMLFN